MCWDNNIHCNLLLCDCCTIFIANWIRTKIFKFLSIPLSSTRLAEVFVLSSTALLIKQLLIKNMCTIKESILFIFQGIGEKLY